MVAFNVSVDDSSPLITYLGTWVDTPPDDISAGNYSAESFHFSDAQGSTASFTFNGTGVWLYGALRPGYGTYSLTVDGSLVASGNASAPNPVFNQTLGGASNLTVGGHTAVLTNTGGGPVDLDALMFEIQLGGGDGQMVSTALTEDSDSSISYSPSSAWGSIQHNFYTNGTAHYTQTNGAQAAMTFTGDAIAVYGGVSFDHGNYTVTIDGSSKLLDGGTARMYHPQSLLYFADGLGSGEHDLTITANGKFCDLDSVAMFSAVAAQPSSSPDNLTDPSNNNQQASDNAGGYHVNASDTTSSASHSISKPVLIGIIAAGVIGLIILILLVLLIVTLVRRRRRRYADAQRLASPVLPFQIPDLEAGGGVPPSEKTETALERSLTKLTMKSTKSVQSRWSQESFFSGPPTLLGDEDAPPVPPMPAVTTGPPRQDAPPPLPQPARASNGSNRLGTTGLSVLRDDDASGQASVVDDYYYRDSMTSTVPPPRPSRPPSLRLEDSDSFEHIPLST